MLFSLKTGLARPGIKPEPDCPRWRSPQQVECRWPIVFQIFEFLPRQRLYILPQLSRVYQKLIYQEQIPRLVSSRFPLSSHPISPAASSTISSSSMFSLSTLSTPASSTRSTLSEGLSSSLSGGDSRSNILALSHFTFDIYCSIFDFVGFPGLCKDGISLYSKKFRTLMKFYTKTRTQYIFFNMKEEDLIRTMREMPKLKWMKLCGICSQMTPGLVNALVSNTTLCPQLQEIDSFRIPNLTVKEMSLLYSSRPLLSLSVQELVVKPDLMELADLLKSEEGYERFVKFLRAKVEPDGAFFWRRVREYQQLTVRDTVEDKALRIWRQYLEVGSPFEIEVGEETWNKTRRWMDFVRAGRLSWAGDLKDQPQDQIIPASKDVTPASGSRLLSRNKFYDLDVSEYSPMTSSRSSGGHRTGYSPNNYLRTLLSNNLRDDYSGSGRECYSPHSHYISLLRKNTRENSSKDLNTAYNTTNHIINIPMSHSAGVDDFGKGSSIQQPLSRTTAATMISTTLPYTSKSDPMRSRKLSLSSNNNNNEDKNDIFPTTQSSQQPKPPFSPPQRKSSTRFLILPTIESQSPEQEIRRLKPSQSSEKLLKKFGDDISPPQDTTTIDPLLFFSNSSSSRSTTMPSYQNTPSLLAPFHDGEEKAGGFFNHGLSMSLKDSLPPTDEKWEENPPLLRIFDLAQDEVYANMVAQDYPRFLLWEQQSKRHSEDGNNMANLILHGELSTERNSGSSPSDDRRFSHSQTIDLTDDPPEKLCCCIIA